jgi:hypothetical protein
MSVAPSTQAAQFAVLSQEPPKPGVQTSEFWVVMLAPSLTTFMSDVLASKNTAVQITMIVMAGFIAAAYIFARTWHKAQSGPVMMPMPLAPETLTGSPLKMASAPAFMVGLVTAGLIALSQLGGCAQPSQSKELATANSELVAQVTVAYTQQQGVTGTMIQTLGDQYVAQVTGNAIRQPVAYDWVDPTTWKVNAAAFTKSVQDAKVDPQQVYLVGEVRAGRMSQEQALAWLRDYATVQALSPERGNTVMNAMCAQLFQVQQAQAAREQALAAHTHRTAVTINALGELDQTAKAWVTWANKQPSLVTEPTNPAVYKPWVSLLSSQIKDPKQRAALEAAMATLDSPTVGLAKPGQ